MNKQKRKITPQKIILIFILSAGLYGAIRSLILNDPSDASLSKFNNLSEYIDKELDDLEELKEYAQGDDIDFDFNESKKKYDLLDSKDIIPENDFEKSMIMVLKILKDWNLENDQLMETLYKEQYDIDMDKLIDHTRLSSLESLNENLNNIDILKSSFTNYSITYNKLYKNYKLKLANEITDKNYIDSVMKGVQKKYDLSENYAQAIFNSYLVLEKINQYCKNSIISGDLKSFEESSVVLYFISDEYVDIFNKLIQENNEAVKAQEVALEAIISRSKEASKILKKSIGQ